MDNKTYSAHVIAQGRCVAISWHVWTASTSSRINFMSKAKTATACQAPTTYEPCFVGVLGVFFGKSTTIPGIMAGIKEQE